MVTDAALGKARRLETLLRVETDVVDGPTGEGAALRVEVPDLEATYWLWPDPSSLQGWRGREVVGNQVSEVELTHQAVAHRIQEGEARRCRRVEAPAPDPEFYQEVPDGGTIMEGDPGV